MSRDFVADRDLPVDGPSKAAASKMLEDTLDRLAPDRAGETRVAGIFDWLQKGRGGSEARRDLDMGPPPTSALKDGDIIFHTSQSEQSKFIQAATNNPLSHVGILFKENGKWMVYEAVQPVKKTALEQFAKRGEDGKYVVRRLQDADTALTPEAISKMKDYLKPNLGKDYDKYFGWGDDRQYCSELVWKAYKHATGKRLGEPKPMEDYEIAKSKELKEAIEKRWGKKLPLKELMIAPSNIYESKLLVPVRK